MTLSFSVPDDDLIQRIKDAGKLIQQRFRENIPNMPLMLPPIPNCSKFIDKFPEEGCSKENEEDRRKQEAYEAEVKVYRALERLKEDIVVLHGFSYTNQQLRLFDKDHKFKEDKPCKEAGECDFVVITKETILIIEVSDVRINDEISSNKRIKTAFNRKKKQAGRTEKLIKQIKQMVGNKDGVTIKWYCAFLSLRTETAAREFQDEQKFNIIFSDSFGFTEHSDHHQCNFQKWWKENVDNKTAMKNSDEIVDVGNILVGLWNIDPQNNIDLERCSLGSNIMMVDSLLRDARITNGFRNPDRPGFNNPNFVQANDIFKKMGIHYLTKEQDDVFKSKEKFLWINGPAGSGKTILIIGKAIEAAKSGGNVVIFANGSGDKAEEIYRKFFEGARIQFDSANSKELGIEVEAAKYSTWFHTFHMTTGYNAPNNFGPVRSQECESSTQYSTAEDAAGENQKRLVNAIRSRLTDHCRVLLLISPIYRSSWKWNDRFEGLEIIKNVLLETTQTRENEQFSFFVDDEQCLLDDKCYDTRHEKIKVLEDLLLSDEQRINLIWVFSDITQSFHHTDRLNFDSFLSSIDEMRQTYSRGYLTLSQNMRNTCDIANILSTISDHTLLSVKHQGGHFIHGPMPVLHFFKYKYNRDNHVVKYFIRKEIDRILWSKRMVTSSNIALIFNSEEGKKVLNKIAMERMGETTSVYDLASTYSTEWPVVVFLMDLCISDDFSYPTLHQMFLGLSRARVHCISLLLIGNLNRNTIKILRKLERNTLVYYHLDEIESFCENGESPLHYAVRKGKLKNVVEILVAGADVNCSDSNNYTPLHCAAKFGIRNIARHLVESGADINCNTADKSTPLHYAAKHGNLDTVKYLVESGADVNCSTSNEFTPLHYAAKQGNLDIVRHLVESGADVNCSTSNEFTPLHYAAEHGNVDIVRYLVESGADVNCNTSDKSTPLYYAAKHGNLDTVKYLVESGADVNCSTTYTFTPLHYAAKQGTLEIVQYLVESRADVNCSTSDKSTPLHYAAEKGNLDIVKYLVESEADVNCSTSNEFTPLHYAAKQGNLDIVRYLVESGAYVNCSSTYTFTPLHYAAKKGNLDIVRYLVESRADVNCSTSNEFTPLHYAAEHGNLDIVRYLVESGADVNCSDSSKSTPLHCAAKQGNLDIVRYLVDSGANVNCCTSNEFTPLHYAAEQGNLDIVRYLVKSGADVNCSTSDKSTPLHYAAKRGNLDILRYLVQSGADVNCMNLDMFTPLHYAAEQENLDILRYLADSGAES